MAGPIDVQLRNAQSSILFMQQEHAHTLHGLHCELQKVQKKCAELTFELAMKGDDDVDEDEHREVQQKMEANIEMAENRVETLHKELEERDRKLFSLEQQLKLHDKKLLSEVKRNKQKLSTMSNELDQKSANIAYLTNQLHQMALVRHKVKDHTIDQRILSNSPQPPQRPPPSYRRRVRTPTCVESVSVLKNGKVTATVSESYPGSSRLCRRLSPSARTRSFDEKEVAAYVAKVDVATSDIDIKPAPPILPPISPFPQDSRSVQSSNLYSPNHSPYYSRRSLRVSTHRESVSTEINSLAVQAVHQRKKDIRAAKQSNRDNS